MSKKKISFEDAIDRLNDILTEIENPDTSLEKSVKLYKEGVDLTLFCGKELNTFKAETVILSKKFDESFSETSVEI